MAAKKCFIYFLVILLIAYPVSAGDVTLNKWVLNVTIHDDGIVEEVIQIEIENGGPVPLEGFTFGVPASRVDLIYDFDHTYTFKAITIEQKKVQDGTNLIIRFNKSIEPGDKWNGRIGFSGENWVVKEGPNYSIDIPVTAPEVTISGKDTAITIPEKIETRGQVFLPRAVEVNSVTPKPFRILFQNDIMVPTWSPDKLKIGDTITIEAAFSEILNRIVEVDVKYRDLSDRIEKANASGFDVSEARVHLKNANEYNNNQALQSFWKKEDSKALEFTGHADNELKKAENSLASAGKVTPEKTVTPKTNEQSPGFGAAIFIFAMIISLLVKKKG